MGAGGALILDAVAWDDGTGGRALRAAFARGTGPERFAPAPRPGHATLTEARGVSGGTLILGRAEAEGPIRIATAEGSVEVAPAAPEWELFANRNVMLAFRIAEPAVTVAEWVAYHASHHGMTGALIVNRAPEGHEEFARALHRALAHVAQDVTVVLVESPIPLGKPDEGPETHLFLAPDAPGKDRMTPPEPDPWSSPLGEGLIHEALKWRFLAQARAVATLDVTDLLQPRAEGQPSAFDLVRQARTGVVMLVGRRIYPWRVRAGRPQHFGDHICRQFDARRGIARWIVAPDIVGLGQTWRAFRIAYTRPEGTLAVPFWRAMAVKIPDASASALAPKTSLVEDPALLALATEVFGHRPVRPPVSRPRAAPAPATAAGRTCIVTTMKNEGPFILEWIAYHRAIGVEDFLVYTNDCTDGTDRLLDVLQDRGIVQHRENPFRLTDLKPQHAALQAAESEPVIQNAGWAICMDVDEFINIKIGDGRLPTLYAAMGEANMISLTWRLFGNADVAGYEDRFILDQFDRCAPEIARKPHQAWGFKTLFRNIEIYKKLGVHRPKGLRPDLWDQVRWLNGSGKPLPREMFRNGWRSTLETYGYDWVQLNHYAVRSAESFLVKRDRGRVNHVDRSQGLSYWFRMNHNAERETSIQRMIPALRAEYDRLLADPDIRAVHDQTVAAHRAKIAELRAQEAQERFYADLTGPRFRALSRMLHLFGSSVFNAGPGVIPEDFHRHSYPEGYLFTVDHQGEAEH